NIDQDAGALGAAALAAVGCGMWSDFHRIDEIHRVEEVVQPNAKNNRKYEELLPIFALATEYQSKLSEALHAIES
ncbi:MAG: pentose kinase, partial [Thermoleophilia bacterium]